MGLDRAQLVKMAEAAREALGTEKLTAIADRGYSSEQLKACEDAGIAPVVPKPITSNSAAGGRYEKWDFAFCQARCLPLPGRRVRRIHRFASEMNGLMIDEYWSSACPSCARADAPPVPASHALEHEAVLGGRPG